jgi:hypothetical protein
MRLTQTKKTYTNHYMPGLFDVHFNYCDLANETGATAAFGANTLRTLFPKIYQQFRDHIKFCPVLVIENRINIL